MDKKWIIILLVLSFIPLAYASFDVAYTAVKSDITIDQTAEFEITINNYESYTDRFRFEFMLGDEWSYSTKPNYLSGIEVAGKSEKKISLLMYPNIVASGQHSLKVVITSDKTGAGKVIWPVVNLKSTGGYVPPTEANMVADLEINNDNKIDPRKENVLRVKLKNKNNLFIEDLTLKVESDLLNIEKTGIQLTALEEKKIEFKFTIDQKILPRKEKIKISWTAKGKDFEYEESFDIIGYEKEFETIPTVEKSFLKTVNKIKASNPGTLEKEQEVKLEMGWLRRLFTSTDPNTDLERIEGKYYLVYTITLKPGESLELTAVTSYRLPIIIAILIVICVLLYYKYRSPITVKKKASIAKMSEGGISELKILLHVKNRSNGTIDEINITDTIPHIGEMDKEIQIGTIKPTGIAKHKTGTIVKWNIVSLERFEERIITYRIRTKLSVLGGIVLPTARVKFKEKGREMVVRSNKLRLKA